MTYCSSLNSYSIVKFRLHLKFWAQERSNGVLISIVRRRENRLQYMANQTDGSGMDWTREGQERQIHVCGLNAARRRVALKYLWHCRFGIATAWPCSLVFSVCKSVLGRRSVSCPCCCYHNEVLSILLLWLILLWLVQLSCTFYSCWSRPPFD